MSMTRRSFAKFFGASMVGVSLAVFGTGLISSPIPKMFPGLDPGKDTTRKYVGPAVEGRWIGGESDTYKVWAKSWETMAFKSGYIAHVSDNVFKPDPLLAYLKKKSDMVLAPSRLADHAGVDVSTFGPKDGS